MSSRPSLTATSKERRSATRNPAARAVMTDVSPEIAMSIVDLGLIRDIDIADEGHTVVVTMTLTTPFCPEGPAILAGQGLVVALVYRLITGLIAATGMPFTGRYRDFHAGNLLNQHSGRIHELLCLDIPSGGIDQVEQDSTIGHRVVASANRHIGGGDFRQFVNNIFDLLNAI